MSPCPPANPEAAAIGELLQTREALKRIVMGCYERAASQGERSLDLEGLRTFRVMLAETIGVPEQAFGSLEDEYERFDFDGSGRLLINEAYKLVKFHLREYLKRLGGVAVPQVPLVSLEQAGYRVSKEIAEGSQAMVKLATNREGREVVVKCYNKNDHSGFGIEELIDEFEAMRLVACERVAQTLEVLQDGGFYYMVIAAYYGGDFTTLKSRATQQEVPMGEEWWKTIFWQCVQALSYMHGQAIMHCDIKEENLMLKTDDLRNPEVVFIDFGVSRAMAAKDLGLCGGTPGYMPPETWDTLKWYPRGDMFSFGVCVVQLMTDRVPPLGASGLPGSVGIFLEKCSEVRDVAAATRERTPPFELMPSDYPDLTQLAQECLEKKMINRPNAAQVMLSAWFADMPTEVLPGAGFARHPFSTAGITEWAPSSRQGTPFPPPA